MHGNLLCVDAAYLSKIKLTTTYYYYIQNCPLAILQVSAVEGCLLSGVPLY